MTELALPIVYTAALMLIIGERLFPAHPIRTNYRWYLRALFINAVNFGVFVSFAMLIEKLNLPTLFVLDGVVKPIAGAMLAYLIFTFIVYWWHRLRHSSPFFWRLFHQLHHSPQRLETLTAYYIHPFDMVANLSISNTIVFGMLGLGIEGAAWYTVITGIAGLLIHTNLRLPRQVGYVFQTPEMHRLHHKTHHHANNYSDIVWWDMLFNTYENPRTDIGQCGFEKNAESRLLPMLLGKDIYR